MFSYEMKGILVSIKQNKIVKKHIPDEGTRQNQKKKKQLSEHRQS